jgi:hypothetical protein
MGVELLAEQPLAGERRVRIAFVAALSISVLGTSPAAAQSDPLGMQWGRDALTVCSNTEDMRAKGKDGTLAFGCLMWINGAVKAGNNTFSLDPEKPNYCTPRFGGSNGQYVAVFLKFLRDNPAKLHLPAILLFHQAMAEAFPCNPDR